jgi:hypothetical protein
MLLILIELEGVSLTESDSVSVPFRVIWVSLTESILRYATKSPSLVL